MPDAQRARSLTARIWADRDVGAILSAYAETATTRLPLVTRPDPEAELAATLAELHCFPDAEMLVEETLEQHEGAVSQVSQRLLLNAAHLGDGEFGPPTGRPICARRMRHLLMANGLVAREWRLTDQAAILTQLGLDIREAANESLRGVFAQGEDIPDADALCGQWAGADCAPPAEAAELLDRYAAMWSGPNAGAIAGVYDPAATLHAPGGVQAIGERRIARLLSGYRAAFPRGAFALHHAMLTRAANEPDRLALRWSLSAEHGGHGRFGPPTQRRIALLGMTQCELRDGLIRREFLLIDDMSIWTQLLA